MPCGRPSPSSHLTVPYNRLFSSSDVPSKGSSKQPKSLLSRPPPPPTQSSSANRGFAGRGATTPEPPTTPSSGPGTLLKQEEHYPQLQFDEKGLSAKPDMRKCAKLSLAYLWKSFLVHVLYMYCIFICTWSLGDPLSGTHLSSSLVLWCQFILGVVGVLI